MMKITEFVVENCWLLAGVAIAVAGTILSFGLPAAEILPGMERIILGLGVASIVLICVLMQLSEELDETKRKIEELQDYLKTLGTGKVRDLP